MTLTIWSCCFLSARVQGQKNTLKFRTINSDQGLPDNIVFAIVQDPQGFLWFCTSNGIARFDGYHFVNFQNDIHDPDSLASNWATSAVFDRDERLWVGTIEGLDLMLPGGKGFRHFANQPGNPSSLSNSHINCLYLDGDGNLWVGTRNGLNLFDRETLTFHSFYREGGGPEAVLAQNDINFIVEDHQGFLWLGSQKGLARFDRNRKVFTTTVASGEDQKNLSEGVFISALMDDSGILWLGTDGGGLMAYEPDEGKLRSFQGLDSDSEGEPLSVAAIAEDEDGLLWVGTLKNGLYRYNRETGEVSISQPVRGDPDSLPSQAIIALFRDRSDLMWVGTQEQGLGVWDPLTRPFYHYSAIPEQPGSLGQSVVWCFLETKSGKLWVGTENGLDCWHPETLQFENFTHDPERPDSLSKGAIWTLAETDDGRLWLGTQKGVDLLDPVSKKVTHFRNQPGNPKSMIAGEIFTLLPKSDGSIWVGSDGSGLALFHLERGRIRSYRHDAGQSNSIASNNLTTLLRAGDGLIWVGLQGGLNLFDERRGTFFRYSVSSDGKGLSDAMVYSLFQDQKGELWIGSGGGLNRFIPADASRRTGTFKYYTTRHGISDNNILAVTGDRSGRIWLSTLRGLTRFDPNTESAINFHKDHGLQSNEFNENAVSRGSDGRLYFGGINGFNVFDPDAIQQSRFLPPVHITSVQSSYQPLGGRRIFKTLDTAKFSHRDRVVTFQFAALDYAAPSRNQYQYQLTGVDPGWVSAGNKREVTYTNLRPGNYRFRVKGSNRDGLWNEDCAALDVLIAFPLWRTNTAYVSYALLLVLIVYLYRRQKNIKIAARRASHLALKRSQARLKQTLWGSGDELWDWDLTKGLVQRTNPLEILGHSEREEEQGWDGIFPWMHPDDKAEVQKAMQDHLSGVTDFYEAHYRMRHRNGNWVWILDRGKVIERDLEGKPVRVAGTNKNIDEIKTTEEKLRLIAKSFENTSDGVVVTDTKFRIVATNRAYTKITGYGGEEVIGSKYTILDEDGGDGLKDSGILDRLKKPGHWQGEMWQKHFLGGVFPVSVHLDAVRDESDQITHFVSVFTDITFRKQAEERLLNLANYDQLTGLPNRTLFLDRLNQALLRASREEELLVVLFLDLDRFKNVNDSLGHASGDFLLKAVAERIQKCLRKVDSVARLGGDEFTIILENVQNPEEIGRVAAKVLEVMKPPFHLMGHEVVMSLSIGISVYPNDGKDSDTLMKSADTAMYHAKKQGGNDYQFFTDEMHTQAVRRLAVENQMRAALERDEFVVYFQPKFDTIRRTVRGLESLVRWQHPVDGLKLPATFIPIAEETGIIVPLGKWVLEETCRQAARWVDQGLEFGRVGVNLSALQFRQRDFPGVVERILAETGIPASLLDLEITEGALMDNMEHTVKTLERLRRLGVSLTLDDFGTGYSSLSYLKRFPIHELKIDRSFIHNFTQVRQDADMVVSILDLAHNLGLSVVAEGVETLEQIEFLKAHGCESLQGDFLCPAAPVETITQLLQQKKQTAQKSLKAQSSLHG